MSFIWLRERVQSNLIVGGCACELLTIEGEVIKLHGEGNVVARDRVIRTNVLLNTPPVHANIIRGSE